jgi:hypothetical protein
LLVASGLVGLLTLMAAPSSASASGLSPGQLSEQGWTCVFSVHAVHCIPPGIPLVPDIVTGQVPAFTSLVFDTKDPRAQDAPFLGTEHNIRKDLFQGQPCPTDPSFNFQYVLLPTIGVNIPYYACHRFNSGL